MTESRQFCKSLAMTQSQAFLCISPITQGKFVAEQAQATLSWRMNKRMFPRVQPFFCAEFRAEPLGHLPKYQVFWVDKSSFWILGNKFWVFWTNFFAKFCFWANFFIKIRGKLDQKLSFWIFGNKFIRKIVFADVRTNWVFAQIRKKKPWVRPRLNHRLFYVFYW